MITTCPICGETADCLYDDEKLLIHCTNHECGSNGRSNFNELNKTLNIDVSELMRKKMTYTRICQIASILFPNLKESKIRHPAYTGNYAQLVLYNMLFDDDVNKIEIRIQCKDQYDDSDFLTVVVPYEWLLIDESKLKETIQEWCVAKQASQEMQELKKELLEAEKNLQYAMHTLNIVKEKISSHPKG